jgi:hypothetical protein
MSSRRSIIQQDLQHVIEKASEKEVRRCAEPTHFAGTSSPVMLIATAAIYC